MLIVCPHCLKTNRVPQDRAGDDPTCGHCHRALLGAAPVALDDASFDKVVATTELPVVVDFWADWCGPCRAMAPQFERAASLRPQYRFAKVDVDAEPAIAGRYAVRSIPTVMVLRDGEPVASQAGVIGAEQLVEALDRIDAAAPAGAVTDRQAA